MKILQTKYFKHKHIYMKVNILPDDLMETIKFDIKYLAAWGNSFNNASINLPLIAQNYKEIPPEEWNKGVNIFCHKLQVKC